MEYFAHVNNITFVLLLSFLLTEGCKKFGIAKAERKHKPPKRMA